jgi:hypothetical protein
VFQRPRYVIGLGLILLIFCSCTHNGKLSSDAAEFCRLAGLAKNSDVWLETGTAHEVLVQLHDQGKLPGDSKDAHGQVTCDIPQLIVSNKVVEMTYPASRTFHVVITGETTTNNYMLLKLSKDSSWKLQRAWEVDINGQVIKEWPVN